ALSELGLHLRAGGDLATALRLHREAEALCRALGDHHNLQRSLGNQAAALAAGADVDGALSLLKEQEAVCREHGNIGGLAHSLTNQSIVLARKGRRRAARAVA